MFDTHCHLNFQAFEGRVESVIKAAKESGVNHIVIPGTDLATSKKAIEIANTVMVRQAHHDSNVTLSLTKGDNVNIYAAIGIHPHHVFELFKKSKIKNKNYNSIVKNDFSHPEFISGSQNEIPKQVRNDIETIKKLIISPKVVAIGEIGIDRHSYQKTKHADYKVDEEFVDLQKEFFIEQVNLAKEYNKALIIHNREAKKEVLEVLNNTFYRHSGAGRNLDPNLRRDDIRAVFHCCEPDEELLEFARLHKMFIGVDGDVVYWKQKQEFIKKVPLEMLVLETDSPYLSPFRKFPNEPKNIAFIAEFVAKLKGIEVKEVKEKTTINAKILFNI